MLFFNRDIIFSIYKRARLSNGTYLYWVEEDSFIYFKEIPVNDNNKFVLDFSDEEFVQNVYFDKNINHYIASLACNLILKEEIKKDKRKLKNFLKKVGFY